MITPATPQPDLEKHNGSPKPNVVCTNKNSTLGFNIKYTIYKNNKNHKYNHGNRCRVIMTSSCALDR